MADHGHAILAIAMPGQQLAQEARCAPGSLLPRLKGSSPPPLLAQVRRQAQVGIVFLVVGPVLAGATRGLTLLLLAPVNAAHFVDVFRTWYGPVNKAFAAQSPEKAETLAAELVDLLNSLNRAGPASLVVPSEYLEVVVTRA